jgi:m7GpppX diphosphatase
VHVVNANAPEAGGMAVGQAHLLDDIISLLELDGMILGKMTLTYGLGERHALFDSLMSAQRRIV